MSGSDEAIVSVDLAGHYNRLASQGPLDERTGWLIPPDMPFGATGFQPHGLGRCISGRCPRRSASTSRLKPYWGKPAVRNFRGGEENTYATGASTRTLNGQWVIRPIGYGASSLYSAFCEEVSDKRKVPTLTAES
jgi:hypothetical protein